MLPAMLPGFVDSFDGKTARVKIPGVTDGASIYPKAVFLLAVGDRSSESAPDVRSGDRVWVSFLAGDPRCPIIMGFRPAETDTETEWFRKKAPNMEFTADGVFRVNASTIEMNGAVKFTGESLTHNGLNVGSTHGHDTPSGPSGPPR